MKLCKLLQDFIGYGQRRCIEINSEGEEGQFFIEKMEEMKKRIEEMPKVYGQDGKGDQAIVYLHYFIGPYDAWITEKDIDGPDGQIQAFGYASFNGKQDAEMGYISIKDIIGHSAELDLHWTPKTVAEALKE